jgi:hypothetical protein
MDVPVSRLNNRMALQLPAELPLGLVFVVGKVVHLAQPANGHGRPTFQLEDEGYRLNCRLSSRVTPETPFNEGDTIRASGHLVFDPRQATYYLIARDIELLRERPAGQPSLTPILDDVRKRAAAASLAPADLPRWVKEIAPPEIRSELGLQPVGLEEIAPADEAGESEGEAKETAGISPELITFLSKAMDSEEEVELTPEVIADLSPTLPPNGTQFKIAYPYDDVTNVPPPEQRHWLIGAAIFVLVLIILAFFTILVLLEIGAI